MAWTGEDERRWQREVERATRPPLWKMIGYMALWLLGIALLSTVGFFGGGWLI
jgi:hypothetical protein